MTASSDWNPGCKFEGRNATRGLMPRFGTGLPSAHLPPSALEPQGDNAEREVRAAWRRPPKILDVESDGRLMGQGPAYPPSSRPYRSACWPNWGRRETKKRPDSELSLAA
jgi:hypothetical protein